MLLGSYYDGIEVHVKRDVYARFLVPHRVISTCQAAGGLRDDSGTCTIPTSEPAGIISAPIPWPHAILWPTGQ
jgi:hypothetical protein